MYKFKFDPCLTHSLMHPCFDSSKPMVYKSRSPSSALSHPFFLGGEGFPTKIDYRKKLAPLVEALYWRT